MYTGHGVACHGAGSWKIGNAFTRNNVMFRVDNSSSSHVDNCKNNFLVLVKQIQNFASACITIMTIVICLLMKKKC